MMNYSKYLLPLLLLSACNQPTSFIPTDEYPDIFPDYIGVTIPENLAELNFVMTDGRSLKIDKRQKGDTLWYTVKAWDKRAKTGIAYKPFPVYISHDEIDPYIVYRLIDPGYESWCNMGIYERELASYKETPIVTNRVNNLGCVNCHTFDNGNPDHMLFHARGAGGGTVFIKGDSIKLLNLKDVGPQKQGVYPAWHPNGRWVAFSSNDTHQCFPLGDPQPIEVYDVSSDIILMNLDTDSIFAPPLFNTDETWETFPSWSPDGHTLYYCAADSVFPMPYDRSRLHYRLMQIGFDADTGTFDAAPDTVPMPFSPEEYSVSLPRVSPDGHLLLYTLARYGTFPIWHREADLWILDLRTGVHRPCTELNSPNAESYHSWSSNGHWILFSSRRLDGRYTRLFIAHHNGNGYFSKPFLLPQKRTDHNALRLQSYNIPEFVKREVPSRQKAVSKLFK